MGNPIKGTVSVEADGQTYTLSYSVNALCELEDATGKDLTDIAQHFAELARGGKIPMRMTRALVWAGLRDHHPEITQEDAGRIMTVVGVGGIMAAALRAFVLAFPEAGEIGPFGAATAPRNGSGRTSSRAGSNPVSSRARSGH